VDPIRNAALFAGLMRDKSMDPFSYSAVDALAQHTIEAARAIGMEDKIGSLEVGKQADLVVFQTSGPEWITRSSNPVLQLIWSSNGASVADVFVAAAAEEAQKRAQILGQTIRP
jgi:5-methylthioadenosine/S-adenosylhomocysteine deaminase